jgi:hypothetical protein
MGDATSDLGPARWASIDINFVAMLKQKCSDPRIGLASNAVTSYFTLQTLMRDFVESFLEVHAYCINVKASI